MKVRKTFYIQSDLATKIKILSALKGKSESAIVSSLIKEELSKHDTNNHPNRKD